MVEDVAALFRRYMDEPDQTFVDDAQMAVWLSLAYDDFRAVVIDMSPYIYAQEHVATLSSARTLELSGVLLGPGAPAATRLYQLVDIYRVSSATDTNNVLRRLTPTLNLKAAYDGSADYALKSTVVNFWSKYSGVLRLDYIPEQNIDWAGGIVVGSNEYIDDLNRFHDIIALTAYLQYAIVDSAENPQLLALFSRRQRQLKEYLENRAGGIVEMVVDLEYM
tara:strand:+ start:4498 stop:5160 length:663 start_codon:yes stop_codon:yes gene_type:complete